jgi:hypothetical protein
MERTWGTAAGLRGGFQYLGRRDGSGNAQRGLVEGVRRQKDR